MEAEALISKIDDEEEEALSNSWSTFSDSRGFASPLAIILDTEDSAD